MSTATALPPEVVRQRMDELVLTWRGSDEDTIRAIRRDSDIVALTVFGLASHVYSLAKAVRVLDDADEGPQIVPLVRQMIECSVTAMWVEKYGRRAAITLLREDARGRRNAFETFVKSGLPDDGSVDRWQNELDVLDPDTSASSEKFWQRCEELDGMSGAYAMFRALSGVSHAGSMVVDLYAQPADVTPESPLGVALVAQPKMWAHDAVRGTGLMYLLLAGMAWDRLDKRHRARTRLKQIAAELGLRLTWSESAVGLSRDSDWQRKQRERRRAGP
ncbi:hypothetical protein [Cellulomonas iranensis]|uniref:hypothetical protein n=1 Tax=Cellulomonas iranensis TaxID=76862 RepID=UPI003D7EDBA9